MLRFLCLLLLLSGSVCGQTPPDSSLSDPMLLAYQPPQRTAADTIQALRLMYRNKRAAGGLLVGLGGVALIATPFAYVAAAAPSTSTYGNLPEAISGTRLGLVIATPIVALGIRQLARSSKSEEEQVVALYTKTHALPPRVKKKLRPALFIPVTTPSTYR